MKILKILMVLFLMIFLYQVSFCCGLDFFGKASEFTRFTGIALLMTFSFVLYKELFG